MANSDLNYGIFIGSVMQNGRTNTLPLHIEILYNEYNFAAAFAAASLLAMLALVTLVLKTFVEFKCREELKALSREGHA